MKLKSLIGNLILVVLGLLLPIMALEGGVRLLHLAPPPIPNPNIWESHPMLGWWHTPNSGGTFYSSYNEYQTDVRTNALRLRDEESLTDYNLGDDVFKILVLADSFGEALQVPLEDTFYKQLQAGLRADGLNAQTINAGVGSWGTDQEASYFRLEGYKFQPDVTLLFFFTRNDTVNTYKPLETARIGGSLQKSFYRLDESGALVYPEPFDPDTAYDADYPKPPPLPHAQLRPAADWLWLHSHLYRWLTPYLQDMPAVLKALGPSGLLGGEGQIRAAHPDVPVPFYTYQTPMSTDWQAAWRLEEAILADLRRQVEAQGSRFAVVIIPAKEQVYPEQWQRTLAASPAMQSLAWDLTLPNQQLARILQANGIPFLDLLPVFTEAAAQPDTPPLYFTHDGHWTAAGHALTAQAVQLFLQDNALLKK